MLCLAMLQGKTHFAVCYPSSWWRGGLACSAVSEAIASMTARTLFPLAAQLALASASMKLLKAPRPS
jgi:hypothetical protein